MIICGVDPGPSTSGVVLYHSDTQELLDSMDAADRSSLIARVSGILPSVVVVEDMHCYGQRVGQDVFATCKLIGAVERSCEMIGTPIHTLTRPEVCRHFCGDPRAKQPQVRHVLRERHGGKPAVGTKKNPGPLYGIKGHAWEALAVALAWWEIHGKGIAP